MTRTEAEEYLTKKGFEVFDDNSVLMVYLKTDKDGFEDAYDKLREDLRGHGYQASFGATIKH